MGAAAWIIGGTLVAVGGVLYLRSRAPAAPPPGGGGGACDLLDGEAKAACEALQTGINLVGDAINAVDDSRINVGLNGAVTKSIPAAFLRAYPDFIAAGANSGDSEAKVLASDLQYANGCVPFVGHPEYGKCAAGTHDLTNTGNTGGAFGSDAAQDCSMIGTGSTRADPGTFKLDADQLESLPPGTAPPMPKPGMEPWFVAFVFTWVAPCAGGDRNATADHRTGVSVNSPSLPPCLGGAQVDRNGNPITSSLPQQGAQGTPTSGGTGRDHRTH